MTTATVKPPFADMSRLPEDRDALEQGRAALGYELRALLASHPEGMNVSESDLSPVELENYRSIERWVNQLDYQMRALNLRDAMENPQVAHIMNAMYPNEQRSERPVGLAATATFKPEELRSAFDAVHHGQMVQLGTSLENRSVTADTAPMAAVPAQRINPTPFPRESTRFVAVLPTERVDAPKVTFYVGSTAASAAAPVAEGALKPESDPAWTATTLDVRKIAHYIDVSTEALADFNNFNQVVTNEGIAGLIEAENAQLLLFCV